MGALQPGSEHAKFFTRPAPSPSAADILARAGYPDQAPPRVAEAARGAAVRIAQLARPQGVLLLLPPPSGHDAVFLGGTAFHPPTRIRLSLEAAQAIALLAATAGPEPDQALQGAGLAAIFLDIAATLVVEDTLDAMEEDLRSRLGLTKSYVRTAPGLCGWDLAEQKGILSLLPADRIGVTLSSAAYLLPQKSATAVIAVGAEYPPLPLPCRNCPEEGCPRRVL